MNDYRKIVMPIGIAIAVAGVLIFLRAIGFRALHIWAKKTETELDDIIINVIKTPSIFWCIAIGLYVGIAVSGLPEKYIIYSSRAIKIIVILSVTFATANLAGQIFKTYVQRANLPIPTTGLAYGVIKGTVIIVGILITLTAIGISITPLITALGIGGLAVALALQDTLANLFAGIHILMEKSIRIGDFIRLDLGQEGIVTDITWRTTRIRMLQNNIIVIPNNKLSQSVVINYSLPEKRMATLIPIGVSYSSDPEKVEKILKEVVKDAIGKVPGLINEEPIVRFVPGFGESSLDFTLVCHVNEFTDQYPVQHELRKMIFKRFKEEGIEIPFPHRTIYLHTEEKKK